MLLYGPKVSIIIPTYNEDGNIKPLVQRLTKALSSACSAYELIFIDDFSDDGTFQLLQKLKRKYNITVSRKVGKKGKAFSLIQGFRMARFGIVGFIDADLQYAPEHIQKMIAILEHGEADIVVANRMYEKDLLLRRIFSYGFRFLFARLLHGFTVDVQSGLKLFRKEVADRISVNPLPWTFDLEFLLKARMAGYRITGIPIPFGARHSGQSKVNTAQAIWEIGVSSLKLKFLTHEPIPFSKALVRKVGYGFHFKGTEYIHFTPLPFRESAFINLSKPQTFVFLLLGSVYTGETILKWHSVAVLTMTIITFFYFIDLLFYVYLIHQSMHRNLDIQITENDLMRKRRNWPSYTILCPLYREWKVIPQFINAIKNMDYPKKKLQVMLLVENDDNRTIEAIGSMILPRNFEVVIVPNTRPKTKPKACNYGLNLSNGEYSVIFDAEDIPDRDQLKKAVLAFEKSPPDVVCIQAKLEFYNPHQNLLTKIFSAEYALWFHLILSGLQKLDAPIPLGGTSNHFKTQLLKGIKGWDSFNVTEDCDLGIRLSKYGYRTALLNSTTMEEANSDLANWVTQRSRWIKGYLQTYLVHMREPDSFLKNGKFYQFLYFQLTVGGKILLVLTNPIMWATTILYFAKRSTLGPFIESLFPPAVFYMGVTSFVFGNFLYAYYYVLACLYKKQYDLIRYTIFIPFYWLLMSFAGWIALLQYIRKPHFWAKTIHGLHIPKGKKLPLRLAPAI